MDSTSKQQIINVICPMAARVNLDKQVIPELLSRGFAFDRLEWLKDKNYCSKLSDKELLLIAYVFDKYLGTDNLFELGCGYPIKHEQVDYKIEEDDLSVLNGWYLTNCKIIDNYLIGYIPLHQLNEILKPNGANSRYIQTIVPNKAMLDIFNINHIYCDKIETIKLYSFKELEIDSRGRFKIENLVMTYDSVYNYIILKNSVNDSMYSVPVFVICDNSTDSFASYRRFNDIVKDIVLSDICSKCDDEVKNLYNLKGNMKSVLKYLQIVSDKTYEQKINEIVQLMITKKLPYPDFSLKNIEVLTHTVK